MHIHIADNNSNVAKAFYYGLAPVLIEATDSLSVSHYFIDKIYVVKEEDFLDYVHKIDPDQTITTGIEGVTVAAKTVHIFSAKEEHCSIVFLDTVLFPLLNNVLVNKIQNLDKDEHFANYVVFHEIAHCKDHCIRGSQTSEERKVKKSAEQLEHFMLHYNYALKTEIAASFLSGRFINEKTYTRIVENSLDTASRFLGSISDQRNPEKALIDIMHFCWTIIIRYTESLSKEQANEALGQTSTKILSILPFSYIKLMKALKHWTVKSLNDYPNWDKTVFNPFNSIWERMVKDLSKALKLDMPFLVDEKA